MSSLRPAVVEPSPVAHAYQDADSEGVEGKFFVWTPAEIREVLGDGLAAFAQVTRVLGRDDYRCGQELRIGASPRRDQDVEGDR